MVPRVSTAPVLDMPRLRGMLTLSCLSPEATSSTLYALCVLAKLHRLAAVCVLPDQVPYVAGQLRGSDVKTCAAIGWPDGQESATQKLTACHAACDAGAQAIVWMLDQRTVEDPLVCLDDGQMSVKSGAIDSARLQAHAIRTHTGVHGNVLCWGAVRPGDLTQRLCMEYCLPLVQLRSVSNEARVLQGIVLVLPPTATTGQGRSGAVAAMAEAIRSVQSFMLEYESAVVWIQVSGVQSLVEIRTLFEAGATSFVVEQQHLTPLLREVE